MPKILFLATEDWFFASHFLPLVKAARDCSLDVVVASRVDRHRQMLEAAGCRVIDLPVRRRSLGPASILREVAAIAGLIRSERPDIVHCIALRLAVLGGVAASITGVKRLVLAVTGLGTLWTNEAVSGVAARSIVRWILRRLATHGARLVFENADDPREFGLDPEAANVVIVPGAGVEPAAFPPTPEPASPPIRFAVVARMLRTKGIAESVEAARRVYAEGCAIELHLFGTPDPANRDSCTELELKAWAAEPGIYWHGAADDVALVWRDHHVALLLSYREGLPRALVEASAAARPLVATDVPGCREVVRDGIEGLLVPPRQADAAAQAMRRLATDEPLRQRMGEAAHRRFMQQFTEAHVREKIGGLYRNLAGEIKPPAWPKSSRQQAQN